jgi:putative flippase GtrA
MKNLIRKLMSIKLINFMVVGGFGYIVNVGVYYPLTLILKNNTLIFGQQFYLPPLIISSFISASANYYFNKISTFKKYKENSLGFWKYQASCWVTLPIDFILVFLFVNYLHMFPTLALAVAVLCVFMLRFVIVQRAIWSKLKVSDNGKT